MIDFETLSKEHAKLFPLADFVSQIDKFDDEYKEYKESITREHQIKELADCVICLIGVYRFAPDVARIMFVGLKDLCMPVVEDRIIVEEQVMKKWGINLDREWEYDPITKKYHHKGKDGHE